MGKHSRYPLLAKSYFNPLCRKFKKTLLIMNRKIKPKKLFNSNKKTRKC